MTAAEYPRLIDEGWRLWDWLVGEGDDGARETLVAKATDKALANALQIGDLYPSDATAAFYAKRRLAIKREQRRRAR